MEGQCHSAHRKRADGRSHSAPLARSNTDLPEHPGKLPERSSGKAQIKVAKAVRMSAGSLRTAEVAVAAAKADPAPAPMAERWALAAGRSGLTEGREGEGGEDRAPWCRPRRRPLRQEPCEVAVRPDDDTDDQCEEEQACE